MIAYTLSECVNRDEDWQDNDGALNTISMTHPHIPVEHPSQFVGHDSECQPLQPGIWLVITLSISLSWIEPPLPT
jgi:hypothetical protein